MAYFNIRCISLDYIASSIYYPSTFNRPFINNLFYKYIYETIASAIIRIKYENIYNNENFFFKYFLNSRFDFSKMDKESMSIF